MHIFLLDNVLLYSQHRATVLATPMTDMEAEKPYWVNQTNVAPIKPEYVLWEVIASRKEQAAALRNAPIATQDDAAEAATAPYNDDEAEGRPSKKQKTEHREPKESKKEKAKRKKNKGEGLKGSDGLCQNTARGRTCIKIDEPRGCACCCSGEAKS